MHLAARGHTAPGPPNVRHQLGGAFRPRRVQWSLLLCLSLCFSAGFPSPLLVIAVAGELGFVRLRFPTPFNIVSMVSRAPPLPRVSPRPQLPGGEYREWGTRRRRQWSCVRASA